MPALFAFLTFAAEGRVKTAEVGEGRGVGQAIEHLGDAGFGGSQTITPVTRSQGVLKTIRNDTRFDRLGG